jgi:hypothetical protein
MYRVLRLNRQNLDLCTAGFEAENPRVERRHFCDRAGFPNGASAEVGLRLVAWCNAGSTIDPAYPAVSL